MWTVIIYPHWNHLLGMNNWKYSINSMFTTLSKFNYKCISLSHDKNWNIHKIPHDMLCISHAVAGGNQTLLSVQNNTLVSQSWLDYRINYSKMFTLLRNLMKLMHSTNICHKIPRGAGNIVVIINTHVFLFSNTFSSFMANLSQNSTNSCYPSCLKFYYEE